MAFKPGLGVRIIAKDTRFLKRIMLQITISDTRGLPQLCDRG